MQEQWVTAEIRWIAKWDYNTGGFVNQDSGGYQSRASPTFRCYFHNIFRCKQLADWVVYGLPEVICRKYNAVIWSGGLHARAWMQILSDDLVCCTLLELILFSLGQQQIFGDQWGSQLSSSLLTSSLLTTGFFRPDALYCITHTQLVPESRWMGLYAFFWGRKQFVSVSRLV